MNIDKMTIGEFKELSKLFNSNESTDESVFIGKNVLVRTYSAGVHVGKLIKKDGTNVLLANASRIYSWTGAFTLSEVASRGIKNGSKVSCKVDNIELTQAIELIGINEDALNSVESYCE